jgi:hypothetical protein
MDFPLSILLPAVRAGGESLGAKKQTPSYRKELGDLGACVVLKTLTTKEARTRGFASPAFAGFALRWLVRFVRTCHNTIRTCATIGTLPAGVKRESVPGAWMEGSRLKR